MLTRLIPAQNDLATQNKLSNTLRAKTRNGVVRRVIKTSAAYLAVVYGRTSKLRLVL